MKIGMVFPGYGSQFVGMGKELYDESRIMQEYFEEASNCLNSNFVKLCFASSDTELARMENAYTALFLVSSSICALLKQEAGVQAQIVAGYNIGEYSAIHAADCFSFPDGLYLLTKYHAFYQEILSAGDYAGVKIKGLTAKAVQDLCTQVSVDGNYSSIAVYESLIQHSVMGTTPAITALRELLDEMDNVKFDDEAVEIGLHSATMDPVALNLRLYLEKVDFKPLTIPLITNADAKIITEGNLLKTALIKQIHSPVLWAQSMAHLSDCDIIIEVGPGTHLTSLLQELYPEKKCIAINKRSDIEELHSFINLPTEN